MTLFHAISGNFFHGPKTYKIDNVFAIFLGGPMAAIQPLWGMALQGCEGCSSKHHTEHAYEHSDKYAVARHGPGVRRFMARTGLENLGTALTLILNLMRRSRTVGLSSGDIWRDRGLSSPQKVSATNHMFQSELKLKQG